MGLGLIPGRFSQLALDGIPAKSHALYVANIRSTAASVRWMDGRLVCLVLALKLAMLDIVDGSGAGRTVHG